MLKKLNRLHLFSWVFPFFLVFFPLLEDANREVLEIPVPKKENGGLSEKLSSKDFNNYAKTYKLSYDGKAYGNSIWMKRSEGKIKAKYFAYKTSGQSVYQRFVAWGGDKNVVMACSGAFSSQDSYKHQKNWPPVGLTVDNGIIVNRSIELDKMDALVIVYATGGIVVTDIADPQLTITYANGKSYKIDARKDKNRLLDWAESEQATIFQTHLLAYKNEKRIDRKARKEERERRCLVLAKDASGDLYHIIYYFKKEIYMYDFSVDLLTYLRDTRDMDVVAMMNLDTGMYDVQEVWSDSGQQKSDMSGDTPISNATNLVVYHYE